jgi:hypothetical protein
LLAFDAAHYLAGHHDQPMTRAEFAAEAALLRAIGGAVERIGDDRAEIADAFLAGLRMPNVERRT